MLSELCWGECLTSDSCCGNCPSTPWVYTYSHDCPVRSSESGKPTVHFLWDTHSRGQWPNLAYRYVFKIRKFQKNLISVINIPKQQKQHDLCPGTFQVLVSSLVSFTPSITCWALMGVQISKS